MQSTAVVAIAGLALLGAAPADAQSSLAGETIRISRAPGSILVDGDLSDEGWRNATRVEKWYEINPGDNVVPPVRSVGYLTYDDRFLYVGFEFDDPNPSAIRAPLGDHDSLLFLAHRTISSAFFWAFSSSKTSFSPADNRTSTN